MFDTIIKNGTIVDGTGADAYKADLAIKDGKIAYKELVSEITEMPNIQKLSEFFGGGCGCGCGH